MPGLNQLKQFTSDVKDLGDEIKIRAERGEKPAVVPLPEGISEEDDSEDFVLGIPDGPSAGEAQPSDAGIPSDSDIPDIDLNAQDTGDGSLPPDLEALLNPSKGSSDTDNDVPDLDDLMGNPVAETPVQEETPLEDLDLDALLNSASPSDTPDEVESLNIPDISAGLDSGAAEVPQADNFSDLDSLAADFNTDVLDMPQSDASPEDNGETGTGGLENPDELDEIESLDDLEAPVEADGISDISSAQPSDTADIAAAGSDSLNDGFGDDSTDEFAFDGNEIDLNADIPEEILEEDGKMPDAPQEEASLSEEDEGADGLAALDSLDDGEINEASDGGMGGDFEVPDFDMPAVDSMDTGDSLDADIASDFDTSALDNSGTDSFDSPSADFSTEQSDGMDFGSDLSDGGSSSASIDSPMDSMEDLFSTDGLDAPAENADDSGTASPMSDFDVPDFDMPQDSGSGGTAAEALLAGNAGAVDASMDVPHEEFDLSGMGDMSDVDFGAPAGNISDEFPVTGAPSASLGDDDFLLDENSFEIPGFSDTETAAFDKKGRPQVDIADFSKAKAGKPKNTLTDEEYVQFRKNLSGYPLNLRLAIEDLIVKNEFTDDAVFEVVEKVLKKTPARQVATHVEKMLDITIDVPRDYERRSVAQYEAYKQSFQYQLKNRIIPGGIAATILAVICYMLFQAGVMFIYKPSMAKSLYKQGYTLLENNEYPQAEAKFADAVHYKPIKKWFFKYADGYREHKQYERAGQMYRNILGIFNHDKQAGLEWAEMELYQRANYEQAENIVRRQVLDYHINDADGLLLLGDIFLEWGESEPRQYETARANYSNLIQLYGATDLYMSRMLRYFVRTDKLRNVLELKNRFYPNKKSLCADDWVELSGYLLDKLYGHLSRADEYLRSQIEDVRAMLEIAEKADPSIPAGHYNMARYFLENSNFEAAKRELKIALDCFDKLESRTKRNTYREIDACRILGEQYADTREYLKAQEVYTRGINLYQSENERTGFEGDENTGHLYKDMGDLEYFISGDMNAALNNYEMALANKNDTASINFRVGAIRYNRQEYDKALTSFIKASETEDSDVNLLLALGNVLSLRGDNFAAQGYYSHLLSLLDKEKSRHLMLFPQEKDDDNRLVEMFLKTNNNLGVTLYRIARQTGDSKKNAEALVRLSDSIRAWDALTRNTKTMVRLGGSNLALQNSKYLTNSRSEYEPAIYTDIPKTLVAEKVLD